VNTCSIYIDFNSRVVCVYICYLPPSHAFHRSPLLQFKQLKENSKLNREMEGNRLRLREFQGDRVAHGYLAQFASPARGRSLNGLGQVSWICTPEYLCASLRHCKTMIAHVCRDDCLVYCFALNPDETQTKP